MAANAGKDRGQRDQKPRSPQNGSDSRRSHPFRFFKQHPLLFLLL